MRKVTFSILIISILFAFTTCAKKEGQKGPYLAKVGNAEITKANFERELKTLPDFAQKIFAGSEGRERFLNELVKKELLYQEALKKGLDKEEEYLKKVEDFKKITLLGLLLEKEISSKAEVTDQDVRDYYEKHKQDFAPFSKIRASLILVKTEDEAKKILERLKNGEDFAKIAKVSSIDPGSAKNGGDLGYLSKDQMTPELESVAVRLKPGEISEPVKTQFGYQIIKLTDKKTGKVVEFEKIKNLIFQHLNSEKQKEFFDSYIESLKKKYNVEINKEALSKVISEEEKGIQEKPEQKGEVKEAPKQETKESAEKKK